MQQHKFTLKILVLSLLTFFAFSFPQANAASSQAKQATIEYKKFKNKAKDLNPKVLKLALRAYQNAKSKGLAKKETLTIIDYSLPSSQKRLWVLDLDDNRVSYYTYVAHGKGSGNLNSTKFSNRSGSKATSLGLYRTDETYYGSNGYSLRLTGLEKGINDNARRRTVVIHGAQYAKESFIKQYGRLGRSWGCPAVDTKLARPMIDEIKQGSLVFAYYPDRNWIESSSFLV